MKPEARLSRDVRRALHMCGYSVWSTEQGIRMGRGGARTTPGIPDLIVIGKGRFAFVELKVGARRLTNAQQVFQQIARENGVECHVWRSVDDAVAWIAAR